MQDELDGPLGRSLEDYWAIALRRRWWILLPLFLVWAVAWGASWLLPSIYESDALILVEQQKVPDQYVIPNVTANLQGRLQSMSQQILSRTRLQSTIDRFHLYPQPRGLNAMLKSGDPVERMRDDIKIELVDAPGRPGELTAFKMHYSAVSPELARQVNSELTTLFIDENLKAQTQLSENTTAFLEKELEDARANMAQQEAKVASFKAKHLGELPSQLESNVQILAGLQAQSQNTERTLDAAKQQKLYLESLQQQYQSAQASLNSDNGDTKSTSPQTLEKELLDNQAQLRSLQSKYTDEHPDIVALKEKIAKAEQKKKQNENEAADNQKEPKVISKVTRGVDAASMEQVQHGSPSSMMQVESQLKAIQLEISNDERREKDIETEISSYRGRLNLTPGTEQELTNISRGYEESKSNYNSLLQKQMQSQLATSLEQRQQGEQFRIIDPPSLPEKPSAPNRLMFSLGGLIAGILLGLGLAFGLELMDVRVRHEQDLEGIVAVRVLVGIPRLSTQRENSLRALRWWIEVGAAMALAVVIVLGNLYAFYKG
jgi:polysaccharide chain length determinant protein (PEP-CTERM system associated)